MNGMKGFLQEVHTERQRSGEILQDHQQKQQSEGTEHVCVCVFSVLNQTPPLEDQDSQPHRRLDTAFGWKVTEGLGNYQCVMALGIDSGDRSVQALSRAAGLAVVSFLQEFGLI